MRAVLLSSFHLSNAGSRVYLSIAITLAALLSGPAAIAAPSLDGLRLMGADGQPLGVVSCASIGNKGSQYGSPVGRFSIWNIVGKYGSIVSDYSAYSIVADHPPALFDTSGNLVGYVSKSVIKFPRIDPKRLEGHLMDVCNQDEYRNDGR